MIECTIVREIGDKPIKLTVDAVAPDGLRAIESQEGRIFRLELRTWDPTTQQLTIELVPDNGVVTTG